MLSTVSTCAFPATAQPLASSSDWTLSTSTTLTSQYVSRGVRQSWGRPALQVGVEAVHVKGWSAGVWSSSVSSRFVEGGSLEADLYAGYSGSVGNIGYSATVYTYRYPGARIATTATRYDYTEVAFGLTQGPWCARYYRTVSRDFFGITHARGTGYLDLAANIDAGGGYTLNLHVGDGRVAGTGNDIWDWRDAKAGITRTFAGGWNAALAVTRARGATGAYDAYTTGVPDSAGRLHVANPLATSLIVSAGRTF
ncbi:MAG: TorF family putative porin [Gammaproteobacteria bacterium]